MHAKNFKQIIFPLLFKDVVQVVVGRCSKVNIFKKKFPQHLKALNVTVKESKHIWLLYMEVLTFAQFKCFFDF